ncbi:MAG: hypothetical protein ACI83L_000032 [Cryomorphaceae bacterium]|jgi:hypothetical protein
MKNSLKYRKVLHNYLFAVFTFVMFTGYSASFAQSSSTNNGNSFIFNTDFLGWDNTINSTLEIRHDTPGENILFGTALAERMLIKPDARISINTGSSLGGTRVGILQDVASAVAINCCCSTEPSCMSL